METQLLNLGRGTAQRLSCGVYPNKFVVRPLHALSPVVGALLRAGEQTQFQAGAWRPADGPP